MSDCAESDEFDGPGDDLEPGLHASMCLMVDEEHMGSVIDWKREGAPLPFVKAVDVTLGEQSLSYSGVLKVACSSWRSPLTSPGSTWLSLSVIRQWIWCQMVI